MMRRIHLIFGIATFIYFLLTGQYMDIYLNHLRGMEDGARLLYRTRHVFILLTAFIHIMLGVYFSYFMERWRRYLQTAGSVTLIVSTVLVMAAFSYEPGARDMSTPVTHWGMHIMLIGIILLTVAGVGKREGVAGQ